MGAIGYPLKVGAEVANVNSDLKQGLAGDEVASKSAGRSAVGLGAPAASTAAGTWVGGALAAPFPPAIPVGMAVGGLVGGALGSLAVEGFDLDKRGANVALDTLQQAKAGARDVRYEFNKAMRKIRNRYHPLWQDPDR
jgi:hypothetical protein